MLVHGMRAARSFAGKTNFNTVSTVAGAVAAMQFSAAANLKRRSSSRDEVTAVAREHVLPPILAWSVDVLNSQKILLERIAPEDYTRVDERMDGSIANHIRHSLNHFEIAIGSVDNPQGADYDSRNRDTDVEHSRDAALERIREVKDAIKGLSPEILDTPITTRFMVSVAGDKEAFKSTVGRELAFAAHHGTHHNAIMSWIAQSMDYSLSDDFGLTYGTIVHHVRADEL